MSEVVIQIEDVSKIYRLYNTSFDRLKEALHPFRKKFHQDFFALKHLSLEVRKGEIIGVVGKNGSGKSTLLKIITGVTTPTSGTARITGKISALLELSSGFNPEYTGIENIYLNGAILGYTKPEIRLKMDEILSFADIGDYVFQPVKTYSSGMLVRLAFSVAITVDPDILIVDEALSVGDALFQRKCFARINSFIEAGKTVLFVSHNLETVTQLCSRGILMDSGEIILDAKPKLVRNYYFKLLYSPADEHRTIRAEIASINRNEGYKKNLEKELIKKDEAANLPGSVDIVDTTPKNCNKNDLYLPDFVSKSMVVTKKYDVDFFDFCMKNLDGEIVNYINTNNQYIFSYKVKFNVPAQKVNHRILFKTTTGINICRVEAPGKYPFHYLEQVEAGETFLVECRFQCNLLNGSYYADVVVWGSVNHQERSLLCKVVDSFVFKVNNDPNSIYKGLVHLEQHAEIKKISGDK